MRRPSLFESDRLTLPEALEMTRQALVVHGERYRHWVVTYSGGKDSSAVTTVVAHLVEAGEVPPPESLTVLYADTRLELPPLQQAAFGILAELARRGIQTQVVTPALDDRFFVYVLGRGVPPPKHNFRWCTPQLKIEPMLHALHALRERAGEKLLMLTGVRVGESAVRDRRIATSCGRDGAECGQGWLQETRDDAIADTLAPVLHWRVCHVWDWLTFEAPRYGYPTAAVGLVYGGDEKEELNARTGCIQCPLASRDRALDYLLGTPEWAHLAPLKGLRPLYEELRKPQHRLRKDGSERRKDGSLVSNPQRLGPLTFAAREWALGQVIAIQTRINDAAPVGVASVELVNAEEERRIHELIDAGTWPQGWAGDEARGDAALDRVLGEGLVQPLLGSGVAE